MKISKLWWKMVQKSESDERTCSKRTFSISNRIIINHLKVISKNVYKWIKFESSEKKKANIKRSAWSVDKTYQSVHIVLSLMMKCAFKKKFVDDWIWIRSQNINPICANCYRRVTRNLMKQKWLDINFYWSNKIKGTQTSEPACKIAFDSHFPILSRNGIIWGHVQIQPQTKKMMY